MRKREQIGKRNRMGSGPWDCLGSHSFKEPIANLVILVRKGGTDRDTDGREETEGVG